MSKAVLISIRPKWCSLIAEGKKTFEIRKSRPKLKTAFKVYIYCAAGTGKNTFNVPISPEKIFKHYIKTGSMDSLNCPIGNQKVIGEFICDNIVNPFSDSRFWIQDNIVNGTCLSPAEIRIYANGRKLYAWHISNIVIYDNPKELSEFGLKRPPQSWCYVELEENDGRQN